MRCPICKKPIEKEFRPFCSERCRTIDLAHWASGTYAVPAEDLSTEDDTDHISDGEDEQ